MRLLSARIPRDCDIALAGDFHLGNIGCSLDGVRALVDWVHADRRHYLCLLGDGQDAITTDDKRFSLETSTEAIPVRQARALATILAPARERILCALGGNHENMLRRYGDLTLDVMLQEIRRRHIYGGYTCKLRLETASGRQIAKLYLWHGPRSARMTSNAKDHVQRLANMKATLRRYLENKAADCVIMAMGHTHKLLVAEPPRRLMMGDNGEELTQQYLVGARGDEPIIEPDRRWYVNTGTYLRSQVIGLDSYAEEYGYDPIELGHAVVEIRGGAVAGVRPVVMGCGENVKNLDGAASRGA